MDDKVDFPKELFKKIRRVELKANKLVTELTSGGYKSVFKGQGIEFEDVREYYPGDDYRKIDWNVTAKHNLPYVKRFREERELNILLLVDHSNSLNYGSVDKTKRDQLIEFFALISFTAITNQDKIGTLFFTNSIEEYVKPTKDRNRILRMIRDIYFYKPKGQNTDINSSLDWVKNILKRRGVIFILTDYDINIDFKKIMILNKKHTIVPVFFEDDFELNCVDVGLIEAIDNESGKRILIDTSSYDYKKFIEYRNKKKNELLNEFNKLNIKPIIINTKDDIEYKVFSYFMQRKKSKV